MATVTHSTDALLFASNIEVLHTTDALLQIANITASHTTDALLEGLAITKSHTTDALLFASSSELTHTTDALVALREIVGVGQLNLPSLGLTGDGIMYGLYNTGTDLTLPTIQFHGAGSFLAPLNNRCSATKFFTRRLLHGFGWGVVETVVTAPPTGSSSAQALSPEVVNNAKPIVRIENLNSKVPEKNRLTFELKLKKPRRRH